MKKILIISLITAIVIMTAGMAWAADNGTAEKREKGAYACDRVICAGYAACISNCINNCMQNQNEKVSEFGIQENAGNGKNTADVVNYAEIRKEQQAGTFCNTAYCICSDDFRSECNGGNSNCRGTNYIDENNDGVCDNKEDDCGYMLQRQQQAANDNTFPKQKQQKSRNNL